ncbi:MAG: nitrite reductase [Aeromicrobium sp.]|uniref:nitrite reductase n=1 Tax=Aeromicrobium sp. TaxID=1871063 RepID=UPI0026332C68|nr:nitrite reductase [Aeromicrobium sp.]MDF1706298.1 nitrite reductase [Aeromicrobium sp.]
MTSYDSGRGRADRCPGVLRPWIAADGALVRLRLVGGRLPTRALAALIRIAATHADENLYLTKRANVQLRALDHEDGCVSPAFVEAVTAAGLLPSPSHELVRNVMVSPLSGRRGGRADLRGVADRYDALVCADPDLAALSARFLVVLDDGRGDLVGRSLDLGAMAVSASEAQVSVGRDGWGEVVPTSDLPDVLLTLARRFLAANHGGAWHVDELADRGASLLGHPHARDLRTHVTALPLPHGSVQQDDGRVALHLPVPDGRLTPDLAATVLARAGDEVVVTPWRSLLLPDLEKTP